MSATDQLARFRKALERGQRPEEGNELRQIELRIKQLENYLLLAKTPGIADLIEYCRRGIREVNDLLSTDRELSKDGRGAERLAMLEKKEVLLYFVGLFDPSAELDQIEKELSERSQAFEDYQTGR